jgi:mannose-6-phosphate isomerase-like protein (cupin superfamily)
MMRRVITGVNELGKAVFTRDDETPHCFRMGNFEMGEAWFDATNTISDGRLDLTEDKIGLVPTPGGVLMRYVIFPPQAEMAALLETREGTDLLSEDFNIEDEQPGMHTTETIDYGFVLEGSITLELDDGAKKVLNAGDCYVQNGTRHAWHNETDQRAVLGVVMLGASRALSK